MATRLKSHDKVPPGGFRFTQETGIFHKFDSTPLIRELAQKVADFRSANKLPRSTFADALEDVDVYNCQRLGAGNRFCYDTDKPYAETVKVKLGGCGACGAPV